MTKKTSPLALGLLFGFTAGLLAPRLLERWKAWAKTPEGKQLLSELFPTAVSAPPATAKSPPQPAKKSKTSRKTKKATDSPAR